MLQLVYLSAAIKIMPDEELHSLLAQSRSNNERSGITGILLYHDGNFIQVLEGEEVQVMNLYYRIEQDSRHRGIIKLFSSHISQRDFPDWSMGYKSLSAREYNEALGYLDLANTSSLSAKETNNEREAFTLLKIFAETNIPGYR
ncbi:BLUF domain-containing protein [Pontibacter akesuensis]|uniref:Sensors of blue-light using FAD n=1 Tax=Pontibacter akesuensis TaxID=388950 RepID=A0A1I7G484_9BACT|nr:BLUF domain-containing protein [Pontibacter akesuensis]GHA58902.1 BluF domain-containing protein [Pontibacter akesuensis]SFU43305.1 Sensors of blue-light using FAD [Pontibacter akesuensis]